MGLGILDSYSRALGRELMRRRSARGWTRRDMCRQTTVLPATLATYELGTRAISVRRLVELCMALGVAPHDVLAAVDRDVLTEAATGNATESPEPEMIEVDLYRLANHPRPAFAPARAWAASRLAARHANGVRAGVTVQLSREARMHLAQLCGTTAAQLTAALREFVPVQPHRGRQAS